MAVFPSDMGQDGVPCLVMVFCNWCLWGISLADARRDWKILLFCASLSGLSPTVDVSSSMFNLFLLFCDNNFLSKKFYLLAL